MEQPKITYDGDFGERVQENSVPKSLLLFIGKLLYGDNFDAESMVTQACLTICQLLSSKSKSHALKYASQYNRDTPLTVFIGLKLHLLLRQQNIINMFHKLGISINYGKVIKTEGKVAYAACERFSLEGVVAPTTLDFKTFTCSALDNIDQNSRSSTSDEAFHGTGISIQQMVDVNCRGVPRTPLRITAAPVSKASLPKSYSHVKPFSLDTKKVEIPSYSPIPKLDSRVSDEVKTEDSERIEVPIHVYGDTTNYQSNEDYPRMKK